METPIHKLNILSWNARGLTAEKNAELQEIIKEEQPQIICIQETHFGLKTKPRKLYGYQYPPETYIRNSQRGGTAIYILIGLKYVTMKTISVNYMEYQGITIFCETNNIDIYNCYVTDPGAIPGETDLNSIFTKNSIIVGDFNIHNPIWNPPGYPKTDPTSKQFIKFINTSNRVILNNGEITRMGDINQKDTTIDLGIVPIKYAYKSKFKVYDTTMNSDHFPFSITTELKATLEHVKNIPKWKTHKADWLLYQTLAETKFDYNTENLDIHQHENQFVSILNEIATQSIPQTKAGTKTPRKIVPWWNRECDQAIRKRESARKHYQRRKNNNTKLQYWEAKKNAKKVILEAKRENWRDFINTIGHRTTSKDIWDKIQRIRGKTTSSNATLLVNKQPIVNNKDKANTLANHYQKVSSTTNLPADFVKNKHSNEIKIDTMVKNKNDPKPQPTHNKNFTLLELDLALSLCKNTAPGEDLINYEMIRKLPISGKSKLLDLFNQSWNEGKSPENWGKAVIIPILKPYKDKTDPASYRPISLTSALTKIMQRMIKARLVPYLEKNNLLPDTQAGCRTNRSCEDHLVKLEADIKRAQLENRYLLAIFLDLSNAFDRCWNKGVLLKLLDLGIKGNMLNWIANFLDNRQISVRVDGELSESLDTENGCPQGSVLSPLLFNVIMNSLSTAIKKFNNINTSGKQAEVDLAQFVDDGAFWTKSQSLKELTSRAQRLLNTIEKWSKQWGFTINPLKTQVIIFSKKNNKKIMDNAQKLTLLGKTIDYQKVIKFLGIHFDQFLTWKDHINSIKLRCNKDLQLLRMISGTDWGADKKSLMLLYQALILSKINYGSVAFNSASDAQLRILQTIQNKALRLIAGAVPGTPANLLQAELACMPIDLQMEQNALKYWARTKQMGTRVPINDYMEDFGVFLDDNISGHIKRPYCHSVRKSLREHGLEEIEIQETTFLSLENIQHKCTPNLTLKNTIDKQTSSPEYMKNYSENFIQNEYGNSTKIYTDGSKDIQSNVTGSGLAIYSASNEPITQEKYKLNPYLSVFTAELVAIIMALNWIDREKVQQAVILSDSLSSLQAIQKLSTHSRPDLIHMITRLINKIRLNGQTIELAWIPSHVDIQGNEVADQYAKKGAYSGIRSTLLPSKKEIFTIIKQKMKTKFHNYIKSTIPNNNPLANNMPNKLKQYSDSRIQDICYTRLRLGWGRINLLRKMNITYKCKSCGIDLDQNHIFFDIDEQCPEYTNNRSILHNTILKLDIANISIETLLFPPYKHEEIIRTAVLRFLTDTKFAYYI